MQGALSTAVLEETCKGLSALTYWWRHARSSQHCRSGGDMQAALSTAVVEETCKGLSALPYWRRHARGSQHCRTYKQLCPIELSG